MCSCHLNFAHRAQTVEDQRRSARLSHCSQAAGRHPTHMDNSGISAQPTTGDGRSWTTCPLLRIGRSENGREAVAALRFIHCPGGRCRRRLAGDTRWQLRRAAATCWYRMLSASRRSTCSRRGSCRAAYQGRAGCAGGPGAVLADPGGAGQRSPPAFPAGLIAAPPRRQPARARPRLPVRKVAAGAGLTIPPASRPAGGRIPHRQRASQRSLLSGHFLVPYRLDPCRDTDARPLVRQALWRPAAATAGGARPGTEGEQDNRPGGDLTVSEARCGGRARHLPDAGVIQWAWRSLPGCQPGRRPARLEVSA